MGMRKYLREIAKDRLRHLKVEKANRHFGTQFQRGAVAKLTRTRRGRRILSAVKDANPPLWRKVIFGDLAKAGRNAQLAYKVRRKPWTAKAAEGELAQKNPALMVRLSAR